MQDLFAEAGLSAGAVYRYFSSKEDMVLAIAEQSMREVTAMIHSFAAAPRGKGLGDALGNVLDVVQRKHAQDQMGAMAVLSWSEALRNPELARRFEALLARCAQISRRSSESIKPMGTCQSTRRPRRSRPC